MVSFILRKIAPRIFPEAPPMAVGSGPQSPAVNAAVPRDIIPHPKKLRCTLTLMETGHYFRRLPKSVRCASMGAFGKASPVGVQVSKENQP
jgi:hypothetical protein